VAFQDTPGQARDANVQRKIVLANVGTLGDLHPLVAIALQLEQRGYATVIATNPDHRDTVIRAGLEFHPVGPTRDEILEDLAIDPVEFGRRIGKDAMYVLEAAVFPYLKVTYDDLLPVLAGASLVLAGSLMYSARFAAQTLAIPHVTIALQPMVFLSAHDPPSISQAPWMARPLRCLGPAVTRAVYGPGKFLASRRARPLDDFRRELHLPETDANPLFDGQFSTLGTLAAYSPVLGQIQPDYPTNTVVTGFPFYDGGTPVDPTQTTELHHFLAAGPPPLVFTLGSFAVDFPGEFYRVCLEATRELRQRAVLLVGARRNEAIHKEHSQDVLVCDYWPYSSLFPHALITIHHGGIGTTGQALRAGKPQLIVPFLGDQFDNAERVSRLGVGRWIGHKRYSRTRVVRELQDLLDHQAFGSRAAAVGRMVGLENGAEVAANAIARLLSPTTPTERRQGAPGSVSSQ